MRQGKGRMNGKPEVSVIIATHNNAEHLGECLDSVLCGQMDRVEAIIVDVLSTDGTKDIIIDAAREDSRVVYLADSRGSIGHAKNTGLDHARAPYVFILEPDDYVSGVALEKLYLELEGAPEAGIWLCETESFGDASVGRTRREKIARKARADEADGRRIERDSRMFRWFAFDCAAMYRKSFLEENGIRHYDEPGLGRQDALFRFYAMSRMCFSATLKTFYYRRMEPARERIKDPGHAYDVCGEFKALRDRLKEDPRKWWEMRLFFWQSYYDANMLYYERLSDGLKTRLSKRMQADIKAAISGGEYGRDHFDVSCRKEMELLLASAEEFDAFQKSAELERNRKREEEAARREKAYASASRHEADEAGGNGKEEFSRVRNDGLDRRNFTEEMSRDLAPLRMLLGMSAEEMGGLLGISAAAYKSLESGKRKVS